jgi:acetoin utilization deacetylase AcuC-like enzyme
MKKLTVFYSPKYHDRITHLNQNGDKEYYLDTAIKPLWVYEMLKESTDYLIAEPDERITEDDLLRVHSKEYLKSLKDGVPLNLAMSSGLRWVPELYRASLSNVNGYYSAALQSIKDRVSCSLSTNFHHATRSQGSGFCVLNGFAIVAKKLISEKMVTKILILDCDYHYGDGNAVTFENDNQIQIFDIYGGLHSQEIDVLKASNIVSYRVDSSEEYFSKLDMLTEILDNFKPEIVLYDAGMDVWIESRIGKISGMNAKNIRRRESFIFNVCKERNIPVCFVIGGGYVRYKNENGAPLSQSEIENNINELVNIHKTTFEEAFKAI